MFNSYVIESTLIQENNVLKMLTIRFSIKSAEHSKYKNMLGQILINKFSKAH
jgi:hypothetical protein